MQTMWRWARVFVFAGLCAVAYGQQPTQERRVAENDATAQLRLAQVQVASAKPQELAKEHRWSNVPEYLAGAKIYADSPAGNALEFEAKSDGLVIIAASWTYDGNASGGWTEGRTTKQQLMERGWKPLDDLTWNEKDTHTLFFRVVKAGEKHKFHTRKYNQPFVVEPDPKTYAAIATRLKQPPAVAKADTPAVAAAPAPAAPPAKVGETDQVAVVAAEPKPISEDEWSPLPELLRGATVLQPENTNALELTAKKDVQLIVAASWTYDGNRGGDWFPGRTTLPQLVVEGWQPIGEITKKERGEHTLLRRTLKAGEQVRFHTRKYNAPAVILVSADKAKALADAAPLAMAGNNLAVARPTERRPAAPQSQGLVLRTHEVDSEDRFAQRGVLLRELVRQSILLAAREELGLATRDQTLRERGGREGRPTDPPPIDAVVNVQPGGRVSVTVFRFTTDKPEILWDKQFALSDEDPVLALTTAAEGLSREELLTALRKAGYGGKANQVLDESQRAPSTLALLADMHPLSQFAAARQLHGEMRDQGESPQRLADLARAYANLGVLTEHLWFTGHKAFKARALLYAERGTNRWPRSPVSLSGRAYARALVGLHQAALDDLAAAKMLGAVGSPEEAAEAGIIERFCRFTLGQVDDAEVAAAQQPLVRMLKMLAVERYAGTAQVLNTANLLLEAVPDSDRAIDAIYETRRLGTRGQAVSLGLERTPQGLYRRLLRWDNLPAKVGMLVSEAGGDDEAAERVRRLELIRALRASGEIGSDASEPSWQAIAAWIEEVAFLQTVRQYEFLFRSLSVPLDETRAELEPLLADHPYRIFLESLCDNREQRRERVKDFLAAVRPFDVSMNEFFAWEYVASFTPQEGHPLQSLAMKHQDWTYRDLLLTSHRSRELFWAENSAHLRRVSPHSPLTIAATIQYDWEFAAPQAAEWERTYADSPQVQGALGRQYVKQEKYESAVRCLKQQAKLQPEFESYRPLAEALLKIGNEKEWLATWNEFLQQEDFGLTHARARVTVAEHFMLQGRWDEAWPYAEAAAGSGAQWTLMCAADCLAGMKQYAEGERYAQSAARRYPGASPDWFFWCRRTGQGAPAAAESYVREVLANPALGINLTYRLAFLNMTGDKAGALAGYREALARQGSPNFAWEAALLAEELKQPEVRDEALTIVIRTGNTIDFQRPYLIELAQLAQQALANKDRMTTLPMHIDALLKKIDDPRERATIASLGGRFLALHGHDGAQAILEQASALPLTQYSVALAAAELQRRKSASEDR